MLFVDNANIVDPRINLAIEEHLLRNVKLDEPLLLFYINEPSVIVGRNQNTLEEIDPTYVKKKGIHVVRRLSGGGAVYHDFGNLNFSFVTKGNENLHNFLKFTEPVVRVLRALGIEAELRGRSDIFVKDKKISGNAQYSTRDRMFSHGTLLFDTHVEHMLCALNPRQIAIESKAVQSVRNVVANVRELLTIDCDIYALKQMLLEGIFRTEETPQYELSLSDWEQIREIAANRYMLWDWNYGRSPQFNIQKSDRFSVGKIDARITVDQGRIQGIKFYGDFFSEREIAELEEYLIGTRYDRDALEMVLEDIDIVPYLGQLDKTTFLDLLY